MDVMKKTAVPPELAAELHALKMLIEGMPGVPDDIDGIVELAAFHRADVADALASEILSAFAIINKNGFGERLAALDASISAQRALFNDLSDKDAIYKRALALRAKLTPAAEAAAVRREKKRQVKLKPAS